MKYKQLCFFLQLIKANFKSCAKLNKFKISELNFKDYCIFVF